MNLGFELKVTDTLLNVFVVQMGNSNLDVYTYYNILYTMYLLGSTPRALRGFIQSEK